MKISIIVPVYNCAAYLERCVKSLIQQTYKDLEIILVNDGSTDGSGDLCRRLAASDTRITVIDQENKGVSAARNTGLEASKGEMITFVDSDDSIDPETCEFMLNLLEEYDADIAHCGYKHLVRDEVRLVHDTKTVTVQNREEALRCLISGKLFTGSVWSKLFRRELLDGIRFNESIRINEDHLFCYEAFSAADKTVFADYAFYNYLARFGESACFATGDAKKKQDGCFVSEYMYLHSLGTPLEDISPRSWTVARSAWSPP